MSCLIISPPFKKVTATILKEFPNLKILPINNHQGISVDGKSVKIIGEEG